MGSTMPARFSRLASKRQMGTAALSAVRDRGARPPQRLPWVAVDTATRHSADLESSEAPNPRTYTLPAALRGRKHQLERESAELKTPLRGDLARASQYQGAHAQHYGQTRRWDECILPAMRRCLPQATRPDAALLDLGCGTGHFIPHAVQKGYKSYLGVDISTDMLAQAKQRHPGARFAAASATNFTQTVPNVAGAFDAVVSIMMVCALARRQDIVDVYRQSHVALNDSGTLVVCVPHPAHDPYMQCGMHGDNWCRLGDAPVQTTYAGYFEDGRPYDITRRVANGATLTFRDYHYSLETLVGCLVEAGFLLAGVDECRPTVPDMLAPSHIVLVARKVAAAR